MTSPLHGLLAAGLVTTLELEANRAGTLSTGQVELLSSQRRQQVVVMVVTAVAALLVAGIWLVALTSFLGTPDPVSLLFLGGTSVMLAVACLIEVGTLIFVRRLSADLVAGRVDSGEGVVAWGGGGYRAYAGTRRLSRLSATNTLEPGAYRLYFLPGSGLLLSADPAPNDAGIATPSQPELVGVLGQAVGFSAADLAANQLGRLSQAQRLRLLRRELTELLLAIGCCAAAVAGIETGLGPPVMGVPFVLAAMAFLLALFLAVVAYRGGEDAIEGGCLAIVGPVTTRQAMARRSTSYWLEVGGKSFQVREEALRAIIPFRVYRVNVTPRSRMVVSLEPVGPAVGPIA